MKEQYLKPSIIIVDDDQTDIITSSLDWESEIDTPDE